MTNKLEELTAGRLALIEKEDNSLSVVNVMSNPYTIKGQLFIKIEPGIGQKPIKVKLEALKLLSKKEESKWQDALAVFHRNNPNGLTCCENCCKDKSN